MKSGDIARRVKFSALDEHKFYVYDDPYPYTTYEAEAIDTISASDILLILHVVRVSYQYLVRSGGTYARILTPRGRIGWTRADNLMSE